MSVTAKPLFDLTKKATKFTWTEEADEAFGKIKEIIAQDIVLMFPDPNKAFHLHFDSSDVGTGAVLQQFDQNNRLRPLEFFSQKFNQAELNYATPDKELFGLVLALKHWRPLLYGAKEEIQIYTDHKSLRDFSKTQLLKPRHARWALVLEEYWGRMKIQWVKGKDNVIADAASRDPRFNLSAKEIEDRASLRVLPPSMFDDTNGANTSSINSITTDGDRVQGQPEEHQQDLSGNVSLQREVLKLSHDIGLAGHGGVHKTIESLLRHYWWKGIREDVKKYVAECDVCQHNKTSRRAPMGKLVPLPIPERNWEEITMDLIVKLPPSKDEAKIRPYDSILVVVDRRSKMSHFIPTNEAVTTEELAHLVFDNVVCKHGVPRAIITDRGAQFKSRLWQTLFTLIGCKPYMSTAYHPETDGQTERTNKHGNPGRVSTMM
ncbi:hypothetical protein SeLEV6574_g08160 [Synchytrium endobioticum]|uniref:Integrase catalytic domain-containing protein n=1 Tax=Synchytrium endobioticum TaxID=286115 RepID=A0A507CDK5_9FUNG|nr:hypothetical protein SeLEV6574_g08160 [Synchytrium endobioticum]